MLALAFVHPARPHPGKPSSMPTITGKSNTGLLGAIFTIVAAVTALFSRNYAPQSGANRRKHTASNQRIRRPRTSGRLQCLQRVATPSERALERNRAVRQALFLEP